MEQRGDHFRVIFRLGGGKHCVSVKAGDRQEAEACLVRREENLRLVERGRLAVPVGADIGLFLMSDGRLDRKVAVVRPVRLAEMFETYRTQFTAGAKEPITQAMEDIHQNHLARLLGGETAVVAITAGTVQQFVDVRSRELHRSHPVKPKTVRKAVATLRFVWNWANRQGHVPTKFPEVELVFAKEKQSEPFRPYDQVQAILAHVRQKTNARYLDPFLVTAAYTGARRSELSPRIWRRRAWTSG